jgi:HNH endonuclease
VELNESSSSSANQRHANTSPPDSSTASAPVAAANTSRNRGRLAPLSATRYHLQLTLDETQCAKLELARDLLSHVNPSGELSTVFERALDALIENLQKRRFGQAKRPRSLDPSTPVGKPARPSSKSEDPTFGAQAVTRIEPTTRDSSEPLSVSDVDPTRNSTPVKAQPSARRRRRIPNALLRQILARDGMRCTFTTTAGHRCDARTFLEVHHDDPWARGGSDTLDNLRLLCRDHNRLLAERDYGSAHVANAVARSRREKQKLSDEPPSGGASS